MKNFYIIFDERPEGKGFCMAFTSMRGVSDFIKVPYDTLLHHFSREKLRWKYYDKPAVKVIRVDNIEKGPQRVKRGIGGHNRNI